MWLADGFHRVAAARQAGLVDIEAIVHDGGRREALLHAVGANARHGLRRGNADKRRAVELPLADAEWGAKSSNWIAQTCGVSQPFVAQVRESTSNRLKCSAVATADGCVMETARIGRKAGPVAATTPEVPERTVVDSTAIRLIEVNLRPPAKVPANDNAAPAETTRIDAAPVTLPPANDDAEDAPGVRLIADLDAAGATVVRLLTALAVDQPEAARRFAIEHGAALTSAVITMT